MAKKNTSRRGARKRHLAPLFARMGNLLAMVTGSSTPAERPRGRTSGKRNEAWAKHRRDSFFKAATPEVRRMFADGERRKAEARARGKARTEALLRYGYIPKGPIGAVNNTEAAR